MRASMRIEGAPVRPADPAVAAEQTLMTVRVLALEHGAEVGPVDFAAQSHPCGPSAEPGARTISGRVRVVGGHLARGGGECRGLLRGCLCPRSSPLGPLAFEVGHDIGRHALADLPRAPEHGH